MKKVLLYTLAVIGAIVVVGMAATAIGVFGGQGDTDEQQAYDAGTEFAYSVGIDNGCETLREGKATMDELLADGQGEEAAAVGSDMIDGLNGALLREAADQDFTSDGTYFISGFWDTMTEACPDAFYEPDIAGRP